MYVKAMESSPPPAPARACATLSLCCTATLLAACVVCAGFAACGRGLEEVGALTFSDIVTVTVVVVVVFRFDWSQERQVVVGLV